eukprot:750619-Hanusia_phi.AAC.1
MSSLISSLLPSPLSTPYLMASELFGTFVVAFAPHFYHASFRYTLHFILSRSPSAPGVVLRRWNSREATNMLN